MRFEAGASACCEHQCPPRLLHPSSSERVLLVSLQALVLKLSSGDYFGEIALLSGKPRQASVKAVGQVTLLVMSRDAFTRLCGNLFGNYIPPPGTSQILILMASVPNRDDLTFVLAGVLVWRGQKSSSATCLSIQIWSFQPTK